MYFKANPPVVSPKIEIMSSRDGSTSDMMPDPTARILFCTGLVGLCVPYRRSMSTTKERLTRHRSPSRHDEWFYCRTNKDEHRKKTGSLYRSVAKQSSSSSNRIQRTVETAFSIHVLSRTREQRVKNTRREIEQHLPIATFLLDTRSMSIGGTFRVFALG